ncbi:MAG: hypothetical protein DRQ55_11975 [Planctomycetota bacterium]|nr:MAG: hypothetical protein DRQ55_11975 [Planctomycetota bacterium]
MTASSNPITAAFLTIACGFAAPLASAQPQALFADDFETLNADNWYLMQRPWRVAAPGECGAASGMAVSNDPATCSYDAGMPYSSTLMSKPFVLSGSPPFTLRFEHMLDLDQADAAGDKAYFSIVRSVPPSAIFLGSWDVDDDTGAPMLFSHSFDWGWEGSQVTLQWNFHADGERDHGQGWFIDNVLVTNSGGWSDLGNGLAGAAGMPVLTGTGTLESGADTSLELAGAHPSAGAMIVVGLDQLGAACKGGLMVPSLDLLIPLATDGAGSLELNFSFPAGTAAGTQLYVQCWIQDPSNPLGWAASNALQAVTS